MKIDTEPQYKIDDPDLSLCNFSNPIFKKDSKNTQWRKEHLQHMALEKLDVHM